MSESDIDVVYMALNREELTARVHLPSIKDEFCWQLSIDTVYPQKNLNAVDETHLTVNGSAVVTLSFINRSELS